MLARLHRQIKHQRRNTLHQVTTRRAKTKSVLVIEDLSVSGMLQNHHQAQAIGDVGFSEFKRQLLYKAGWYGARVIVADRWEPSSKRCSDCGWLDADLILSDRAFHSEQCGLVRDRDLNAAINLEMLAGSFLGQSQRLWSGQLWRTVWAARETGGEEAGTKRQGWRVHAWVSLGERSHMAKLYFTHGTMGAQKTTQLLAAAHNFEEHGGRVLITKSAVDTKGDRDLVSRIGLRREADFLTTPEMDVQAEVLRRREEIGRINAVLVDEAQFLQPAQVDQLLALAVLHAIPVMAWGLRTDFRTRSFPGSLRLLEIAHELRESIAMCGHGGGCEHRAQFNARMVNGFFVAEGDQVAIDGEAAVTYTSLCAGHYMEDVGPIAADAN